MRLFFLFALTGGLLHAQSPVITRADYFDIGDSVLIYHKSDASLSNFSPGLSGANALWDFSAMDFSHPSVSIDTVQYMDPVGTWFYPVSISADYSMSNLCFLRNTDPFAPVDNDFNYLTVNNDSVCLIGHWANNGATPFWEDHCTNLIKEIAFPCYYNLSYVDAYTRFFYDMSGSDGHYLTGTNTVTADGYGTLITPDSITIADVLRVHSIETVRDSNMFGISNYTVHTYRWYSTNVKGCILSVQMTRNNPAVIEFAEYQKQTNFNTSIGSHPATTAGVLIYPNPGNGLFTIAGTDGDAIQSVELFNATGQLIFSDVVANPQNRMQIDLAAYGSGIYSVRITTTSGMSTGRIVVE